jgi:hypothetical protein
MKKQLLRIKMEIKDLYPGKEVMVRRHENETWFLHWYKYTSKKGFHTEEYGKIPFRYIADKDKYKNWGKLGHVEGEIDFKSKECKNQIKELKKAFKDLW